MKKLILSFVVACIAVAASAQISQTPIKTFNNDGFERGFVFDYSNGEQVIIRENYSYEEGLVNIYDLSFNLKKIINLSAVEGFSALTALDSFGGKEQYPDASLLVTEKIFNNDELLEMIIFTTDGFAIVNENGVDVFRKKYTAPSGYVVQWVNCSLLETKNGNILVVDVEFYNSSTYEDIDQIEYYALPGYSGPSGIKSATISQLGNPYPNPARTFIKLPYELPYGVNTGTVRVFNAQGKLLKTMPVNGREEFVRFDTTSLPAGNYFFALEVRGQQGESKPFIVVK